MKLHNYFRSSASFRVRIALNLKGLSAEHLAHHLRKGEQCAPAYLAINPQGLVPTLQDDQGAILTQSLAIIEWLDETHPTPPLLPKDPLRRARVRTIAINGTTPEPPPTSSTGESTSGFHTNQPPIGPRSSIWSPTDSTCDRYGEATR